MNMDIKIKLRHNKVFNKPNQLINLDRKDITTHQSRSINFLLYCVDSVLFEKYYNKNLDISIYESYFSVNLEDFLRHIYGKERPKRVRSEYIMEIFDKISSTEWSTIGELKLEKINLFQGIIVDMEKMKIRFKVNTDIIIGLHSKHKIISPEVVGKNKNGWYTGIVDSRFESKYNLTDRESGLYERLLSESPSYIRGQSFYIDIEDIKSVANINIQRHSASIKILETTINSLIEKTGMEIRYSYRKNNRKKVLGVSFAIILYEDRLNDELKYIVNQYMKNKTN